MRFVESKIKMFAHIKMRMHHFIKYQHILFLFCLPAMIFFLHLLFLGGVGIGTYLRGIAEIYYF